MFKNILGLYSINIHPNQAKFILELMSKVDIYEMSVGEYMDYAVLQNKLEEIVEESKK